MSDPTELSLRLPYTGGYATVSIDGLEGTLETQIMAQEIVVRVLISAEPPDPGSGGGSGGSGGGGTGGGGTGEDPFTPATLFASGENGAWYKATDITTIFSDDGITNVTANNDVVKQWNDKSGNDNHATQSEPPFRPTYNTGFNGVGAIRFLAADQHYLEMPDDIGISGSGNRTIMGVVSFDTDVATGAFVSLNGGDGGGAPIDGDAFRMRLDGGALRLEVRNEAFVSTLFPTDNVTHIMGATFSGSTTSDVTLHLDFTEVQADGTVTLNTEQIENFIGRSINNYGNIWLHELIVLNRSLTDSEIDDLKNYWNTEYASIMGQAGTPEVITDPPDPDPDPDPVPFSPEQLFAATDNGTWIDFSDNTQVFIDDGITNVSAADDLIRRVNDKSGKNNHAIQAAAGNRPKYDPSTFSRRCAKFFAEDLAFMELPDDIGISGTQERTMLIVAGIDGSFGEQIDIFGLNSDGLVAASSFRLRALSSGTLNVNIVGESASASSLDPLTNTIQSYGVTFSGTTLSDATLLRSGTATVTLSGTSTINTTATNNFISGQNNYSNMYVFEVLIINRKLTDTELGNLFTYWNTRYTFGTTVPENFVPVSTVFTPDVLFANGENGVWYNATDDTSMWTDDGITQAVAGDGIYRWDDQSGNANHAYQTTVANQPTLDTTTFTSQTVGFVQGSSHFMNMPDDFGCSGTNDRSVFFVGAAQDHILSLNGALTGDTSDAWRWTITSGALNLSIRGTAITDASVTISPGNVEVYGIVQNAPNPAGITFHTESTSYTASTATTPTINTDAAANYIGRERDNYATINALEILAINRAMTSNEVTLLLTYWANKYGTVIPGTNPPPDPDPDPDPGGGGGTGGSGGSNFPPDPGGPGPENAGLGAGTTSNGDFLVSNASQLRSALNSATGGDVIVLEGGNYGDFDFNTDRFNSDVTLIAKAGEVPLFIRSDFLGSRHLKFDSIAFKRIEVNDGASHLTFQYCDFYGASDGPGDGADKSVAYMQANATFMCARCRNCSFTTFIGCFMHHAEVGLAHFGATDIVVRDCRMDHFRHDSMKAGSANRGTFVNNKLANTYYIGDAFHEDHFQVQGSSFNFYVRGNTALPRRLASVNEAPNNQGFFGGFNDTTFEQNILCTGLVRGISVENNNVVRNNTLIHPPQATASNTSSRIIFEGNGNTRNNNIWMSSNSSHHGLNGGDYVMDHTVSSSNAVHPSQHLVNFRGYEQPPTGLRVKPGSPAAGKGAATRLEEIIASGLYSEYE